jgi:hypothetical protein
MPPKGSKFTASTASRQLLVEVMPRYINIIENRATLNRTSGDKDRAWEELTLHYNTVAGQGSKTQKQLRDMWRNMKAKAKTDVAEYRRLSRGTGGGPAPQLNGISELVVNLIPQQLYGLVNNFDADRDLTEVGTAFIQ